MDPILTDTDIRYSKTENLGHQFLDESSEGSDAELEVTESAISCEKETPKKSIKSEEEEPDELPADVDEFRSEEKEPDDLPADMHDISYATEDHALSTEQEPSSEDEVAPIITKTFQITIHVGRSSNKKINYANSLPRPCTYSLQSSDPELL